MSNKIPIKLEPKPLTIAVSSIECLEETDEVGADEPYVIVVGADLTTGIAGASPNIEATLYGPWSDVDKGEVKDTATIPPNMSPEAVRHIPDSFLGSG